MTHPVPQAPLPAEPFGPVVIGAREIYDAVVRVSAKVDLLSMQMTQLTSDQQDMESRLRALERARWPLPSVSLLVAISAVAVSVFYR